MGSSEGIDNRKDPLAKTVLGRTEEKQIYKEGAVEDSPQKSRKVIALLTKSQGRPNVQSRWRLR
jgi:hypothetical protein